MNLIQRIRSWFVQPVEVVKDQPLTKDEKLYLAIIRESQRQRAASQGDEIREAVKAC